MRDPDLPDHSAVGAQLAREITTRMGFQPADVHAVAELVALHLFLPSTATQRDLDDPTTAQAVANRIGDRRLLDLLAVLTQSDARAASGHAWSSWRAGLVSRLVDQVRGHLEAGPVPEVAAPKVPEGSVQVPGHDVSVGVAAREDGALVWAGGKDRVGLLADVAGTLTWAGLTIRGCRARVDTGRLTSQWDVAAPSVDLASVSHRLRRVLDGSVDLWERIGLDRNPGGSPPTVAVLPSASGSATVLEVRSGDRRGLLWRILSCLAGFGIEVRSAHADTLGVHVVDVVYVLGADGKPVVDEDAAKVVASLAQTLSGEEPAAPG